MPNTKSAGSYTDRELDEEPEFLEIEIENPEDAVYAQTYAIENPETMIALDNQFSYVQRGGTEKEMAGDLDVQRRIPGGLTTYPDEGTYELVLSDGCFQDFRDYMLENVQEQLDYFDDDIEAVKGVKDIFLDNGRPMEDQPKLVGFAAHVTPNLFGASWREDLPTEQTLENIDQDVTAASPEEYKNSFKTVDLWENLTDDAERKEITEIIEELEHEPEYYKKEERRSPESCVVETGPNDVKPAINWFPGR